jgi:hypothetical protein
MKKLLLKLITLTSLILIPSAFAEVNYSQDTEIFEESSETQYKIKEIREYLKTIPNDSTCIDEYLKRRKNLAIQLSLTPVTLVGSFYGGAVAGAIGGSISYVILYQALGVLSDPNGGWAQLGYMIGGGVLGAAAGSIAAVSYSTVGVIDFIDNQRLLKALMEAHHNEIGPVTTLLHEKYLKKHPDSPITAQDYSNYILEHDRNGNLCNGSLKRKKARFKPNRLSKKLANTKDLAHFIL